MKEGEIYHKTAFHGIYYEWIRANPVLIEQENLLITNEMMILSHFDSFLGKTN